MAYEEFLQQFFPSFLPENVFVDKTYAALNRIGFNADNTIACVCLCRDEITQPLAFLVRQSWGESFNLSGLGGLFYAGKTALHAAMHHSPNPNQRERYVFFALPHIAIDEQGRIGVCKRAGRDGDSTACGALDAFRKELVAGNFSLTTDSQDVEQSLLRQRLTYKVLYSQPPSLLELTKIAQQTSQQDLENTLKTAVDLSHSDYGLISGIQIHGPEKNYVWLASFYAIVNGKRNELGV